MTDINFSGLWRVNLVEYTDQTSNIIDEVYFEFWGEALLFMKIYNDDGNLNLYGFMFKSVLFGLTYFGFVRLTTFV